MIRLATIFAVLATIVVLTLAATASARSTVILIHGGGWYSTGPAEVAVLKPDARRFQHLGWRTENIDYRPWGDSLTDVLAAIDRHPTGRLCLYGRSAGGHLALVAAYLRPRVNCVISAEGMVAPLDSAFSPKAAELAGLARRSFGPHPPSPLALAPKIRARLLLETGATSDYVNPADVLAMAARAPHATALLMQPGPATWVHYGVSHSSLRRAHTAEARLLRSA